MMEADKIKHLAGGALCTLWALGLLWVYQRTGIPAALLYASSIGIGVELYQAIRHEGTPDPADAVATAVPFIAAAIGCHIAGLIRL